MPLDDADKKAIADLIKTSLTTFGGELDKKFVTGDAAQKMVGQGITKGLADAGLDKVGATLTGPKPSTSSIPPTAPKLAPCPIWGRPRPGAPSKRPVTRLPAGGRGRRKSGREY